jgi:hypothetical protein
MGRHLSKLIGLELRHRNNRKYRLISNLEFANMNLIAKYIRQDRNPKNEHRLSHRFQALALKR